MINLTIVGSIIIGLSIYDLIKALSTYIYEWMNKDRK